MPGNNEPAHPHVGIREIHRSAMQQKPLLESEELDEGGGNGKNRGSLNPTPHSKSRKAERRSPQRKSKGNPKATVSFLCQYPTFPTPQCGNILFLPSALSSQQACEVSQAEKLRLAQSHLTISMAEQGFELGSSRSCSQTLPRGFLTNSSALSLSLP